MRNLRNRGGTGGSSPNSVIEIDCDDVNKSQTNGKEKSTPGKKRVSKSKENVGWTNLPTGRTRRKKQPAEVVVLSSDTDFEEPLETENPQVVPRDNDSDDRRSEIVLFDAVSDSSEPEEVEKEPSKAKRDSNPKMKTSESDPVTPMMVDDDIRETEKSQTKKRKNNALSSEESDFNVELARGDDNEDDGFGRDSDQASYATFFRPTKSLLGIMKNNEKKKRVNVIEESSDSDSVPLVSNDGGEKSSPNGEENSSESIENQESSAEETSDSEIEANCSRKRRIITRSSAKRSRLDNKKRKSVTKRPTRVTRHTSRQLKLRDKDSDKDSNYNSHRSRSSSESEDEHEVRNTPKKGTRRSQRQVTPKTPNIKEQKKQEAFEKLRKSMENKANKPKRQSPVRAPKPSDEEEVDEDSESDESSGLSPCPIVSDSATDSSDFDGSTPSSSSVTSSGETDEEPDLEIGGSDGEKDLPNNSEEVAEENEKYYSEVDSCSSSSDEEPPSDGQNDQRCILCKNLRSANIVSRSYKSRQEWCKCGECLNFSDRAGDYDLVCCREIKTVKDFVDEELEGKNVCITKHPRFKEDVLKNEGFARAISKHREPAKFWHSCYWRDHDDRHSSRRVNVPCAERATRSFENSTNEDKTWKSFSSYKYWIFDKLSDRDSPQMVIPACVKAKVYKEFGTLSKFFPFRARYTCPGGQHCINTCNK